MSANFNFLMGRLLFFVLLCFMGAKVLEAETIYQTTATATLGAEKWSDGTTLAEKGKHYALDVSKLTDGGTSAKLSMPDNGTSYTFTGDSLTIGSACSLIFPKENVDKIAFVCKKLCLADGATVAGKSARCYFDLGSLNDDTELNLSGTAEIKAGVGRNVRIYSDITGSGVLKLCGWGSGTSPYAAYYLRGGNSKFYGSIDTTRTRTAGASFDGVFSTLDIYERANMGGALPELDRRALVLNHYVETILGRKIVLEKESNRGVAVVNGATIINKNDFEIGTMLSLHGELRKSEAGKLILSGEAAGFGTDGMSATPTAGKNVLKIQQGGLVIGSADAINGVAVTLAAGTTLELRPDFSNEELLRYGIRNDKINEPFILGSGLTSLPFSIIAAKGKPKGGVPFRMGLFTVKNDSSSVDMIRQTLVGIQYSIRGFESKLVEVVDEEMGNITFAIDYMPKGARIVVR